MLKSFILILGCLCVYPLEAQPVSSLDKDIQHILDKERKKYKLPALSLSIQFPNNEITNYVSGYDTALKNKKITQNTLFQMGSITKTFTATIIYKLIEENKYQ